MYDFKLTIIVYACISFFYLFTEERGILEPSKILKKNFPVALQGAFCYEPTCDPKFIQPSASWLFYQYRQIAWDRS